LEELRIKKLNEMEPEIVKLRIENTRDDLRSDHMDEWKVEELCAFFEDYR